MITEKMMKDFVVKLAQHMESHPEKFFVMCLDDCSARKMIAHMRCGSKPSKRRRNEQEDKENRLDASSIR